MALSAQAVKVFMTDKVIKVELNLSEYCFHYLKSTLTTLPQVQHSKRYLISSNSHRLLCSRLKNKNKIDEVTEDFLNISDHFPKNFCRVSYSCLNTSGS